MINKIDKTLKLTGCTIQEAEVFGESPVSFWHSNILDKNGNSISSGFSKNRNNARKIAIAEFLERRTCEELNANKESFYEWGFDKIPTACGFAAGFNKKNTVVRSINEAAERWVMSNWIDNQRYIEQIDQKLVSATLDPISKFFLSQFEEVLFFSKKIIISLGNSYFSVTVAQTMGIIDGGIYPGSSAQTTGGSIWQHALLESFRHLLIIKNNQEQPNTFPDNKVRYFSKNATSALNQIKNATNTNWTVPNVVLHKCNAFENGDYFLARTILDGWKSWHDGPIERFLY